MIDLKTAIKLAEEFFAKIGEKIIQINESKDYFIVFGADSKNEVKYGKSDIKINKISGEITDFILPSPENFKLLRESTKLEIVI